MKIIIEGLEEISKAAQQFIETITDSAPIYAFEGEMGAGKTTFIKAVCQALGVKDVINSPTFAIVNEYVSATSGRNIYHFDFYRINSSHEALDFGTEEYFYSGDLCFIEWPERVADILPEGCVKVQIKVNNDGTRQLTVGEN